MGLRMRGETVDELAGFASAMRERVVRVEAPAGTIDIVGTGGDGSGTFNISTTAALIVAACGVPVAKHGNRAITSKSGSADVLDALGIRIDHDAASAGRAIRELGFAFLFAPAFHPAMRHAGPTRREIGVRTAFNLLGPAHQPGRRDARADRGGGRGRGAPDRGGAAAPRHGAVPGGPRRRRGRAAAGRVGRDLRRATGGHRAADGRRGGAGAEGGEDDGAGRQRPGVERGAGPGGAAWRAERAPGCRAAQCRCRAGRRRRGRDDRGRDRPGSAHRRRWPRGGAAEGPEGRAQGRRRGERRDDKWRA